MKALQPGWRTSDQAELEPAPIPLIYLSQTYGATHMAQKFPALAGLMAGIVLTLAAGAFGSVIFTGSGISDSNAGNSEVIYPNF